VLQGVESAVQKNINTEPPLVARGCCYRADSPNDTGTVEYDVQSPETIYRRINRSRYLVFHGDVTVLVKSLVAKVGGKGLTRFVLNVADANNTAFSDEPLYSRRTQPAGAASNQCSFIGQSHDGVFSLDKDGAEAPV
jgi:hypothetical protein